MLEKIIFINCSVWRVVNSQIVILQVGFLKNRYKMAAIDGPYYGNVNSGPSF